MSHSEIKLSPEQLQKLLQLAARKTNISPQELEQRVRSGALEELLRQKGVSQAAARQLLQDPNQMQALLNTPAVRQLLQQLMKGK